MAFNDNDSEDSKDGVNFIVEDAVVFSVVIAAWRHMKLVFIRDCTFYKNINTKTSTTYALSLVKCSNIVDLDVFLSHFRCEWLQYVQYVVYAM